jgi:putative ATP-dependent endonuclease of OLD family
MRIDKAAISNYRNLDGVEIIFDPAINFLIGENELGKSNLLDLFDTLFNRRQFSEEDFTSLDSPIQVRFSLRLSEAEKGVFDDYFDPDDNNVINVTAIQEYSDFDENINFFWTESLGLDRRVEIPRSLFRMVNYIAYDSLKAPQYELTFHRGRGSGKFLSYLVSEFDPEIQVDIEGAMASVIGGIQSVFDRLKPLKQQGLGVYTDEENSSDLVSRVLKLSGRDGFDIQKSGYGLQFSSLLLLSILERLVALKRNKRFQQFEKARGAFTKQEYEVFCEMYMSDESDAGLILEPITGEQDGKYHIDIDRLNQEDREKLGDEIIEHIATRKSVSMVLGLDEPEIHLHPYMQRYLIKYILDLLQNRAVDFLFLLKEHFDIDTLDGQVLVVSHSPTVLLGQYKHIVRFHRESGVEVISGSCLNLDPNIEKHLLLNLPYIEEAFFSRCVVLVEGETELGAFPLWANDVIGDLDEYGITVVSVDGKRSVPPVAELLNRFGIPNVSIIDKDRNNDVESKFASVDGLRTTNLRDFEEELFETVCSQDSSLTALFDLVEYYDDLGLQRPIQSTKLDKIASETKYNIDQTWTAKSQYTFVEAKECANPDLLKAMFLAWMDLEKTITMGRALGRFIGGELIPEVYEQLFQDAKSKAIMS